MSEPTIEGALPGVSVGPTTEFSLFFRVKDGEGAEMRQALEDMQDHIGYRPGEYNIAIETIHEARFVLFDDDTRLTVCHEIRQFRGTLTWTTSSSSGPTLEYIQCDLSRTSKAMTAFLRRSGTRNSS